MSWKNVRLIFQREVRDQLRDRRTLFMVAVLPLLLYPALGIGMVQMTVTFAEQVRRVVIVGASQLPDPSLLVEGKFNADYLGNPDAVDQLQVATDLPGGLQGVSDPEVKSELARFLRQVDERRDRIERLGAVQEELDQLPADQTAPTALLQEEQVLRTQMDVWFADAPAQVLIVIPTDFRARYEELNRAIAEGALDELEKLRLPHPIILHNSANEKSEVAYRRIENAIRHWEADLLNQRLKAAHLPLSLPHPLPVTSVDLAEAEQLAANVWSKIFPALLVIMSVTGAFYPAIDLGAGEKERGTMETLLISPASRTEIVFGKFLTVVLFSFSTALLNLTSMGFTGKHMFSAIGAARSSPLGDLSIPPLSSLFWVILLAIPLSALFSALSLSLAMFARSSKEGQYYLTPLLLVTMGLTMFCLNPGVELTPYYSVLPVTGPALLLKALLLGGVSSGTVGVYAVPVLLSSCLYSTLALWWATEQFQREDILFREAERFELGIWVHHLLREKEPTPSFAEATVCFVLIALLQFVFLTSMQGSPAWLAGPRSIVTGQMIYLVATVGAPPLLMAVLLTTSARRTLKLIWPKLRYVGVAVVLGLTLQPLALQLMTWLDPFFPPLPPGTEQLLQAMGADSVPVWLSLAAFAIAPAVCEELAFRGFILSGLQRSRRHWLPIIVSALLFGVIHMIPKQQFNAALLGIVLGLLAVRSGSLLPGFLFHALFNGMQVVLARVPAKQLQQPAWRWLFQIHEQAGAATLEFSLVTLLVCLGISLPLLIWLVRQPSYEPRLGQQIVPLLPSRPAAQVSDSNDSDEAPVNSQS